MPARYPTDEDVLDKYHAQDQQQPAAHSISVSSKRTSSTVSTRSMRRSPSPPQGSRTPLTPDESPEIRVTRKRDASVVEAEDRDAEETILASPHSRVQNNDTPVQVCICQPDPKIPRPRNAFILYRQHHQASVVAKHPGLANPEISKIIGEQWRNQTTEVKNEWKSLAEEEKLRHQQQYPSYRYQPKRDGRRNSASSDAPISATNEKARCQKCGGRTILSFPNRDAAGSSPLSATLPPPTPRSDITPISRTLPVLKNLALQSPAASRRIGRSHFGNIMTTSQASSLEERDDLGVLSPESKRRRYNGDQAVQLYHPLQHRQNVGPYVAGSHPGTPFPFNQTSTQAYMPAHAPSHRESLPGLRGVVSPPAPMAPPPRPGPGYHQHRISQGHLPDRSLILPPIQTGAAGGVAGAPVTAGVNKSPEDLIMSMDLLYKIKVLGDISPPSRPRNGSSKGILIVVEGDSATAATDLSKWLADTLSKNNNRTVSIIEGPDVSPPATRATAMAQYHRLVAEWLEKSEEINDSLSTTRKTGASTDATTTTNPVAPTDADSENKDRGRQTVADENCCSPADGMDVDAIQRAPVSIIPNYSLHASNVFACRIPIADLYTPRDHWQWAATQWRGTAAPDLTIYIKDSIGVEANKHKGGVEIMESLRLFMVRRVRAEPKDTMEVEPSVLRRLGFEVGERVMAGDANASENSKSG